MDFDSVVIGAGVVGIAVARELARRRQSVLVLEAEAAIGTATSSRNSGVIHAGIYYPRGSLKAQLCVRGKHLLYEYCRRHDVPHRQCGKLIVATSPAEVPTLEGYRRSALENGAGELPWLDASQVHALEPAVACVAALHSPSTGIIDVHELMYALRADLESAGGTVLLGCPVSAVEPAGQGLRVSVADGAASSVTTRAVVNSAGLAATAVARLVGGLAPEHVPAAHFARGHYYALRGPAPFGRLVYPVAEKAGLGTHVTVDLAGRVRFGPDVEWIPSVDYQFTSDRRSEFAAAIRRYYPELDADRLVPDYTGVRPKIHGPTEPAADFRIDGPERHGLAGLVNLFGIESPGLTASLAIAERVADILAGR
ncbi:MAG: NAD(P)/FAD-dependent oxidoreductase [Proteobacteria bacterium]|nr:NAD(P)/FAD-dependent oxidoreductase [Pseudomonadota bacterium]